MTYTKAILILALGFLAVLLYFSCLGIPQLACLMDNQAKETAEVIRELFD